MKKVAITQDLCRMVELMLKGGAQQKEVGERLGISKATVSRIKTAGYDPEQYRKNTEKRVADENKAEEKIRYPLTVENVEETEDVLIVTARQAEEQVSGQMRMDLIPAKEPEQEMSDQTKLMRFQAGQVEKLMTKMDKVIDYLAQILRKMDG